MKDYLKQIRWIKGWVLIMLPAMAVLPLSCETEPEERERPKPESVRVEDGVMLWESGEEVALFGVNYQPAFAHSHRALRILGQDHKQAIEEDVYHFSRMGFDAYRIHMWDREVTDSLGNLLQNEHLDLHDYTIHKMNERDIKTILTPTTYYSNAYPDGATPAPGFSNYISKGAAPQNPEYWPVIKNYLEQLIHHVNPYTGMNAIEDPNIIALEIDNEPSHSGYDRTLEFINTLADHLRDSGWDKPIFYNISHNFDVTDAKLDARIDGVTYQWYPAGLVGGQTIRRNYFPYVNNYTIPWEEDERHRNMALMVYEFDPADNMHNYALPMMARSFREAGMQWATQFAYDPLSFAHMNSDYPTHYLNMVYTPNKAVSALIASEIFSRVDREEQFDDFPADTVFGDFLLSHHLDLSEMNAEEAFLYSNDTGTRPRNEAALERIAGAGSSPVVSWPGTGAYFLDKLDDGVWRLEVMPDAIPVRDPFESPDYNKHVTHIEWRDHTMEIDLSNLGPAFSIEGLNEGNDYRTEVRDGSFTISPGAWLLTREGVDSSEWTPDRWMGTIRIGEYHAVPANTDRPVVKHRPSEQAEAGEPLTISANVAGLDEDDTVRLFVNPYVGPSQNIEMEEVSPYRYEAEIPAGTMNTGVLRYWIVIDRGGDNEYVTFPGDNPSAPWRWNFYYDEEWTTLVIPAGGPVEIWNAGKDHLRTHQAFSGWGDANRSEMSASVIPGRMVRHVASTEPTEHRHVLGISTYIADRITGITSATLDSYGELVVRARTDYDLPADLKVVLVDHNANSYSATVPVDGQMRDHRILLQNFESDRFMLLPRAYPTIMESWYATGVPGPVKPGEIEQIQFLIDTSGTAYEGGEWYGFEVESAWLDGAP